MPEISKNNRRVVNALADKKNGYVRVIDWEGKSLPFILANEISPDEVPLFPEQKVDKK